MTNTYIGQLEPFVDGSNFDSYEDRVCQFMKANKISDDDMKVSVFISIMGEDNYDTLKSLTVPHKPSTKTFDELLGFLRNHFNPPKNKRAERYKFYKAVQNEGESINEFIVRLKSLAQSCRFGEFKEVKMAGKIKDDNDKIVTVNDVEVVTNYKALILDEALTDRFIVGINNSKIQQRLLNEDDLNFEQCCLLAINMELSQKESQGIQPNKSFVNRINGGQGQNNKSHQSKHSTQLYKF